MARKLAVVLLAVAMILSYVGTAAAAQFSDIAGYKHEAAIGRLASLGLLAGYPDGTFKPDQTITRAEFAKVIVIALGLKEAAEVMTGVPTAFSDVAATHWATGYINVAASQGIVNGYPDGTFKPDAQVTYAEALAMILRALGYEPTLKGVWPAKYLVKAAELGITKGVTFSANVPATRGDVAALVDNALTVKKVKQTGYGDQVTYQVTNDTLLSENLGCQVDTGIVTAVQAVKRDTLKANEFELDGAKKTLAEGVSVDALLGHKVNAWKNADGEYFMFEDLTPASSIVTGKMKAVGADSITFEGPTTAASDDVVYKLVYSGLKYYRNKVAATWVGNETDKADYCTLILDADNKVRFIDSVVWNSTANPGIVKEVKDKKVYYWYNNATPSTLDLSATDAIFTVVKGGKQVGLDDIKPGDLVYIAQGGTPTQYYLEVVDNKVSGDVTSVQATGSTITSYKLVVGGASYSIASNATYTDDDNATITAIDTANVANLVGAKVTIHLDKDGKVRHVNATKVVTKYTYLLVKAWDAASADAPSVRYLQFLKPDGTKVTYAVSSGVTSPPGATDAGKLYTFTLGSDGKINSISPTQLAAADATVAVPDAVNKDYDRLTVAGATYFVMPTTVIYYWDVTAAVYRVASWTQIEEAQNGTLTIDLVQDANYPARATYISVKSGVLGAAAVTYAVVKARFIDADGVVNLVADVKGTEQTYKLASSGHTTLQGSNKGTGDTSTVYLNKGDLVKVSVGADGKATVVEEDLSQAGEEGTIPAAYGIDTVTKTVKIEYTGGSKVWQVTADTVIYDVTGDVPVLATFADLAAGQTLQVLEKTGAPGVAGYIKITGKP